MTQAARMSEPDVAQSPIFGGVDLGGTKIRVGFADRDGRVLVEREVPTPGRPAEVSPTIAAVFELLATDLNIVSRDIVATGVGGAGVPVADSASFSDAPNLNGIESHPLADELKTALGHPVVIENDVNAAALGELHAGIGRIFDSFVFVSLGTGVGMGIVVDRRLLRGVRGAAGEIARLPFGADPLEPTNQRRGALEEALAGDALVARFGQLGGTADSARAVFDLADAGDVAATTALDEHAHWTALGLLAVDAILDPGPIVLGGGIGGRPELLRLVRVWAARLGSPDLDVRTSRLGGRAPVIGAIRTAIAYYGEEDEE